MEKLQPFAEAADLLIKVGLAIAAFLFVNKAEELRKIQQQQATLLKIQAEAQSIGRRDDHELIKLIIDLLFKQDKACRTEDEMMLVSFLSEMNDQYNRVKLGDRMAGVFGKRRECETQNPALAKDTQLAREASQGEVLTLTPENVKKVTASLPLSPAFKEAQAKVAGSVERDYDGFVALGRPLSSGFTNFTFFPDTGRMKDGGDVSDGSILRSKWSVYLRTNTTNTEEGTNPIIGLISERQCVRTLEATPNVRGQTWARVKLVSCPS